jgi:hypothetical protein
MPAQTRVTKVGRKRTEPCLQRRESQRVGERELDIGSRHEQIRRWLMVEDMCICARLSCYSHADRRRRRHERAPVKRHTNAKPMFCPAHVSQ